MPSPGVFGSMLEKAAMPATLFEAPPYDPARERRRTMLIAAAALAVVALLALVWAFRNWPAEHVVDKFFAALQQQQFETAYGIWQADPDWKQHPDKYKSYPYAEFYRDWGPGGDWGVIKSYSIVGTAVPPPPASGVVVVVNVNQRVEQVRIWVQKKDKSLSFSPM